MRVGLGAEQGRLDYVLLLVAVALVVVGIEAVYSASFAFALAEFKDPNYLVIRQGVAAAIGIVLLLVTMRIDYRRWRQWSVLILALSLFALIAVLLPGIGKTQNGATRWINLGSLPPFQPSEAAKLALIVYLAAWLSGRGDRIRRFASGPLPFLLLVAFVGALILLQPDMGTAVIAVVVAVVLLFLGGGRIHHLALIAAGGLVLAVPVIAAASYRASRLAAFLDPWADPQGKGFHIIQSLIALGSGGVFGRGIGASRQKFFYVPGSHTDAIYAIIGEELGLLGCAAVVLLFALLAYRGFRIALRADDDFGALLAAGITTWLCVQAIVNIGGVTKLIPFTGVPLPFISYGGSALMITLVAVGILLSISRSGRVRPPRRT